MKLVVDPKYADLTDFLLKIPGGAIPTEAIYKNNRNFVTRISYEGISLVVKQFKIPNQLNKFVYTWLRKSKARRSFEYAQKLLSMDIGTAEPVAYIEIRKSGLFHTGYFVSEFIEDKLLNTLEQCDDTQTRENIIRDFSRFTADMHEKKKIFHKDYNSGNIFYRKEKDGYHFSVIDINRLRFRKPKKRDVVDCFARLTLSRILTVEISAEYAILRGWNPDTTSGAVLMKKGVNIRKKIKNFFKMIAGAKNNKPKAGKNVNGTTTPNI